MSANDLRIQQQHSDTPDGWRLELRQAVAPAQVDAVKPPLLIVPGYGMNNFIFGFHPRGTSMERGLAEAGYEVWSVNMRGQGGSRPWHGAGGTVSLDSYASMDLPTAVGHVLHRSKSRAAALVLIGCSLGGSIAYGYMALRPTAPVAGVIGMGAPLRWNQAPRLVKVLQTGRGDRGEAGQGDRAGIGQSDPDGIGQGDPGNGRSGRPSFGDG